MNVNKDFFLAGRNLKKHNGAIFTLEIPSSFYSAFKGLKSHYTYKIKYKDNKCFVNLLTGPDNNSNYSYIGLLNSETGELLLTEKSKATESAWSVRLVRRVFACIWEHNGANLDSLVQNGFDLHHENRCGRCGKRLTTPNSINFGLGEICMKKMGILRR